MEELKIIWSVNEDKKNEPQPGLFKNFDFSAIDREIKNYKKELKLKETRLILLKRHLNELKENRIEIKDQLEKLKTELKKEKNKSWWKKIIQKDSQ